MVTTIDVLTAVSEMLDQIEDKLVKDDIIGAHEDVITAREQIEKISQAIKRLEELGPLREKIERKGFNDGKNN